MSVTAAALQVENGVVREIRLALGGVAQKPWRASVAEQMLKGREATAENFAAAELAPAQPQRHLREIPTLSSRQRAIEWIVTFKGNTRVSGRGRSVPLTCGWSGDLWTSIEHCLPFEPD